MEEPNFWFLWVVLFGEAEYCLRGKEVLLFGAAACFFPTASAATAAADGVAVTALISCTAGRLVLVSVTVVPAIDLVVQLVLRVSNVLVTLVISGPVE